MQRVLFVCLGNICRSPLAEGLANKVAEELGLENLVEFDSCGTSSYHIGQQPDERTLINAKKNGLELNHNARQFEKADFREFDFIIAMDAANKSNIQKLDQTGEFDDKLFLMRDFDPKSPGADVPDPYFGGEQGFQNVFEILDRSVRNFIEKTLV